MLEVSLKQGHDARKRAKVMFSRFFVIREMFLRFFWHKNRCFLIELREMLEVSLKQGHDARKRAKVMRRSLFLGG